MKGGQEARFEFSQGGVGSVEGVVIIENGVIWEERTEGGRFPSAKFGFLEADNFEQIELVDNAVKRTIGVVRVFGE